MRSKPLVIALSFAGLCALPGHAAPADVTAVEYYNAQLKHYFFTTNAAEASFVDNGGAGAGWVRTGRTFAVWSRREDVPTTAAAVSRFYSSGANSHFFTASASEADSLRALQRAASGSATFSGWKDEGNAFFVATTTVNGSCAVGTSAVSRLYNDGFKTGDGSNHRFVSDEALQTSMQDDKWIAEGVAFCEDGKSNGSSGNGNTPVIVPASGAFSGPVLIKIERAGSVEVKSSADFSASIDASGNVTATGAGCTFTGALGTSNTAVRKGTLTATGCADTRLNGAYGRSTIELFTPTTMLIRFRQGDGDNEISLSGVLSNGAVVAPTPAPTPSPTAGPPPAPTPSPGTAVAAATYAGNGTWTRRTRSSGGGGESISSTSNDLTIRIAADGTVSGSGAGCTFSGKLAITNAALGILGGTVTLAGCSDAQFNATYAAVVSAEDGGAIELELENENQVAGVETKLKVQARLAQNVGGTPTPAPTPSPSPSPSPTASPTPAPTSPPAPTPPPALATATSYAGTATWFRETKGSSGGSVSPISTTVTNALRINIAADGTVSGGGYGCTASGKLSVTSLTLGTLGGNVTLGGCTDSAFSASYVAVATAENAGALEVEMEHETQTADARTKLKVAGRLARQ